MNTSPYYYNVTSVQLLTHTDNCDIEFQITAVIDESDVHHVIHLPTDIGSCGCHTNRICSGNTAAYYFILVEESESIII